MWPVGIRKRNEWVKGHFLKSRTIGSPVSWCVVRVSAISVQQATPRQLFIYHVIGELAKRSGISQGFLCQSYLGFLMYVSSVAARQLNGSASRW